MLIITNAETSVDSLILCIIFGCAGSLLVRGFFSSCGEQELPLAVVGGLVIVVASLSVEHGL